jgi:hypothetical protein
VTKPIKGKPWCSLYKINTHSSESCWVLHPRLRPSYLKEHAAQSGRQAKVVSAKVKSSLNVKTKPALLSATKDSPPAVKHTTDSYYAEVVSDEDSYQVMEPLAVNVRAATTQRRSTEIQRLRQVTQADMPLSYLPYSNAVQEQYPPNKEPAPLVQQDELESYTPRQFQSAGGDDPRRGRNMVDQGFVDATNLNHYSSKESDNEEMPTSFAYLSEGYPIFQGALEFVMEKQLPRRGSMLRTGSKRVYASDHEASGEQSGTPQASARRL